MWQNLVIELLAFACLFAAVGWLNCARTLAGEKRRYALTFSQFRFKGGGTSLWPGSPGKV